LQGRKRVPSVLSELHGRPGKRKRLAHEPRPAVVDHLPAPDHLGDDARYEWERIITELQALKMITSLDLSILSAWCTAAGDYVASERQIRQEGLVVDSRDRGLVRSPWLLVRNKAIEQMIRLGSELGLSPASRPRISVAPLTLSTGQARSDCGPKVPLAEFLVAKPE
jgi:P27 family predicted phage terminase small subunit